MPFPLLVSKLLLLLPRRLPRSASVRRKPRNAWIESRHSTCKHHYPSVYYHTPEPEQKHKANRWTHGEDQGSWRGYTQADRAQEGHRGVPATSVKGGKHPHMLGLKSDTDF